VARVTEVHRDAVQPLAQVRAAPLAHVDTDSEVMLVWFRADHPAAPVTPRPGTKPESVGELSGGNAAMQPQVALHAAPVATPTPTPKPASPKATPPASPPPASPAPASPAPALPGQTP
jgi:hypothetical protein